MKPTPAREPFVARDLPMHRLAPFAFLLLTAGSAAFASAPPPSSADGAAAVLARAKEAAGGQGWDRIATSHVRGKLRVGGIDGTFESIADVRTGRYVDRYVLGPTRGAAGFDGKTAWTQDASGQPIAEEGDDARLGAADEAYRRAVAYWYPERWPAEIAVLGPRAESGRDFDVLRITPRGGRPFEVWIDRASGLFDRVVETAALQTRTTFFSNYRDVDGVKVPFAQRSTTGETRYDQVSTVESVTHDRPVAAAAFAMPPPPPPDFALAGGAASVSMPFELLNNHIHLDVKLDGKGPYRLLCDTGSNNIVTPELAKKLGLKPQGALQGLGAGEKSEDFGLVTMTTIEVGGATLRDQVFAVFELGWLSAAEGVPVDGIIGYELFKRFVVRVDYPRRTLTLTLPAAFSYHGGGVVLPFKFNEYVPEVAGEIDGVAGAFDIDTGSRTGLDVLGPFVDSHGLRQRYAPRLEGVSGWGIGGPVHAQFARAGSLRLGALTISRPPIQLALQTKGAFSDKYVAGNVGAALLRLFAVTFDYARQQLIFERPAPTALGADGDAIAFDRAGLWLNLVERVPAPPAFAVVDVYVGSPPVPAAVAGLLPGDLILAVDGKTPRELPLPALRERLRTEPPGTRVRLTVDRAGQRAELVVVLRDLI
jgi:Aspartyl protease/PDZ domain